MFATAFSLLVLLSYIDAQTPIQNFVAFGTTHGDQTVGRQLDTVTLPIHINIRFPFFNKWYDEIRVYSHGLILFGNISYTLPHQPPGDFPITDFVCAAPYWADTDISQDASSNIFYRQISDESTLVEITSMIRRGFPLLSTHRMLWAFVATWFRVPGHMSDPGRNTYQAIIATNGLDSFTIYTYHQIQWSAGLWGGYPLMGFNAGDAVNFFKLPTSFGPDIMNVVQDSNIAVPGQFIFHTTGNINNVQCNTTQGLQSSPFRGSMYGGYELKLFGVCFNHPSYRIEITGETIRNCTFTPLYITCIMPMVSEGRLQINVFTPDGDPFANTDFLSFLPETNADSILSNFGELNNVVLLLHSRNLHLKFLSNALTTNHLFQLTIYDYSIDYMMNNNSLYNQQVRTIDLGLGLLNLSAINNLTINYTSILSVENEPDNRIHALGISFETTLSNTASNNIQWINKRTFIVRPFLTSYRMFSGYCLHWLGLQTNANTLNLTNQVPACPCRIRTTWDEEQLGFDADPTCNGQKSGTWNCQFNRGARGCYQRKSTTSEAGAHCCYDRNGVRITTWSQGSGSIKAHHPETWKTLSMFYNFFDDLLPHFSCCGIGGETLSTCGNYFTHRPPGRCDNILPVPTGGQGDPHFSTLDGNSYTFNGHGEYTLLKSIDGKFEVQVRLATMISETVSTVEKATAIVALVIHNEDHARVQFELFHNVKLVEVRLNGQLLEYTPLSQQQDSNLSSSLIYSDDRQLKIRERYNNSFSVSYGDSGIQFLIYIRPQFDFLDLVSLIPKELKGSRKFQGLLGGFDGLAYANGTTVSVTQNDDKTLFSYGESWRTTSTSSLFYYRQQDNHAKHQDFAFRPIFEEDLFHKYANTTRYQIAMESCHGLVNQKQCEYDILVTDDPQMINMYKSYETVMENINQYVSLVQTDAENEKTTESPTSSATNYFADGIYNLLLLLVCAFHHY